MVNAYPQLTRCVVEMAYDNGVICRFRTKEDVVTATMAGASAAVPESDLVHAEAWLSGRAFSDSEINDLCCGGTGDNNLPLMFPDVDLLTNRVLNDLFDNLTN
jgi:hypothetical protein